MATTREASPTNGTSGQHFQQHNTNPTTLSRFIMEEEGRDGGQRADLAFILNSISVATKVIANAVAHAGVQDLYGMHGMVNVQGEDQKKLDVLANDVMINAIKFSQKVAMMVSEENNEPIMASTDGRQAKYTVVFDPLDGSSNIECNIAVGTIFGIYETLSEKPGVADVLQPGNQLVAAGYVLYSSSVVMVLSVGQGVHSFTLDPNFGEFIMTRRNLRIPSQPKQIYSINCGNSEFWEAGTRAFVEWTKVQSKPYSLRYVGSMVSDVHRTLLYGGIFMYPADQVNRDGKLRLLYECFPMAFLVEQAGGMASDGVRRILDIKPGSIHQRSPIFLGCRRDVEQLEACYKKLGASPEAKRAKQHEGRVE